jgi:hypothetical protein
MSHEQRQRVAARAERFGGDLRSLIGRRQQQQYDDDDDEIDYSSYTIKGEHVRPVTAAPGAGDACAVAPCACLVPCCRELVQVRQPAVHDICPLVPWLDSTLNSLLHACTNNQPRMCIMLCLQMHPMAASDGSRLLVLLLSHGCPPALPAGTKQELEKSYFRLTIAPQPHEVRPDAVLRKALARLVGMIARGEGSWLYYLDQFKGMRQDITIQHIRNDLTVQVRGTLVALDVLCSCTRMPRQKHA